MAVVPINQWGDAAIHFQSPDLPVAVTAEHQPSVRIQRQPVRARLFSGKRRGPTVAAVFKEQTHSLTRRPFVYSVRRNIRKKQIAALLLPDRSFDPGESVCDLFHGRNLRYEAVKSRIETDDCYRDDLGSYCDTL